MSTKPTPGPWECAEDDEAPGMLRVYHKGTRQHVCSRIITPADGPLIAAAPDLLAALEQVAAKLDRWPKSKRALHPHFEALQQARAAIAKATTTEGDR